MKKEIVFICLFTIKSGGFIESPLEAWFNGTYTQSTQVSKTFFLGDNSAASKCKRDNGRTLVSHHLSPEFPESLKPGICSRHLPIHTLLNAYSLLTLFTLKYVFWQLHISVALGMRPVPPRPLFPPRVLGLSHLLFPFFPFLPGELD